MPFFRKGGYSLFLAACLILISLGVGLVLAILDFNKAGSDYASPVNLVRRIFHLDSRLGRTFFEQVIPSLKPDILEEDTDLLLEADAMDLFFRYFLDIRYQSPQELLRVQIPLLSLLQTKKGYLSTVSQTRPLPEVASSGDPPRQPAPNNVLPEQRLQPERAPAPPVQEESPRILLYHTHTSESFIPVSGQEHNTNGKGDIVQVGRRLCEVLNEKYGIKTIHCETIHDYYPFRDSYQRSEKTIREYLKNYPKLEILIDMHRDATPGIEHRVQIKGKNAAKLILVVGSDRMGLAHPHWKKNHRFAQELVEAIDRFYPGLSHGVILSDARYNQHLHEKALIIEVGDHNSTLDEALYSVELLAETLAAYLNSSFQSYSI